jgi:hypothetical protein
MDQASGKNYVNINIKNNFFQDFGILDTGNYIYTKKSLKSKVFQHSF